MMNGPKKKKTKKENIMTQQTQSEQIGKLAEALAKAQSTMTEAKEDSKNPFFKSNYADLTSIWRACKKSLSDNGLSVTQPTTMIDGQLVLVTKLLHAGSGEWTQGFYPVYTTKQDPQAVGSAITYARRYALAAIVGVCKEGEDDDAEKASDRKELINDDQIKDLIKAVGADVEAKEMILKRFSAKSFNEIPKENYVTVRNWLATRQKEKVDGKARVA
jgi:ERF superfamily